MVQNLPFQTYEIVVVVSRYQRSTKDRTYRTSEAINWTHHRSIIKKLLHF